MLLSQLFSKRNYLLVTMTLLMSFSGIKVKAQMYAGAQAQANVGMWGSGYWGGAQGCNYPWQQGGGAVDIADEVQEEYKNIASLKLQLQKAKLEKKQADSEMDLARRKLERSLDSAVLDFILDTHMEKLNLCSNYKSSSTPNMATGQTTCEIVDANGKVIQTGDSAVCGGKDDIPEKLNGKWLGANGYCTASSTSSAGNVSSKICTDNSLKPEDAPKYRSYSTSECGKSLTNYRKFKIKSDKAQDNIERIEDEIKDRQYAISDARERAKLERQYAQQENTESYCPECMAASRGYSYSKPKKDWASIIGQVGVGLGLGFLGAQYDKASMEYQAQLGYPPQQGYPTAVSMGLPFILGGVYGAINGGSGQGGFGCAAGMGGSGYPYGVQGGMNGPFGGAGGIYGPYASGGVFGYPQGMYGSPWGNGMYMPGYGPGGMVAGPWGGFPGGGVNGAYGINAMINGGFGNNPMIMCVQAPCPGGQMAGMGMGMPMNGMQMPGMYPGMGMAVAGGIGMGMPMNGMQMPGMYPGMGMAMGGMQMPGMYPGMGMAVAGGLGMGMPMSGMQMPGMYPGMGMAGAGGLGMGMPMGGYQMMDPSQMQMQQQQMQMQMQMQQQQMQQYMQYQQAQMQAQMQAYQRQMAMQQQATQVQQEIMSLQMRLQMIYSGQYSYGTTVPGTTPGAPNPGYPPGGGYYPSPGGQYPPGVPNGYPTGYQNTGYPNNYPPGGTGSQVTVPNGR